MNEFKKKSDAEIIEDGLRSIRARHFWSGFWCAVAMIGAAASFTYIVWQHS